MSPTLSTGPTHPMFDNAGHRSTIAAHMSVRGSKSPMAIGVTYDRYRGRRRGARGGKKER